MGVSRAHIKATAKYNKANYKQLKANIKPADYQMIDDYCVENDISKAALIVNSIKYVIDNDIDIKAFIDEKTEK